MVGSVMFDRRLPEKGLALLAETLPWWQDLLDYRFKDVSGNEQPLFLAIRDRYFNAYVEGHSVFKVHFNTQVKPPLLRARIHHKYVDPNAVGQAYLSFDGKRIIDRNGKEIEKYEGSVSLDRWVRWAQTHMRAKVGAVKAAEKQGVAVIVARNAHVIDVEMALPGQPSADRIDIVALEKDCKGFKIVFYEAKLFSNHASLRADNLQPKVLNQLKRYEDWIRSRPNEIIPAYRRACGLLIRLHAMRYTKTDLHAPSVHPFVLKAAKEGSNLQVDPKPRLIVFGYSPSERVGSWKRHECALRQNGVRLIMKPRPEDVILPEDPHLAHKDERGGSPPGGCRGA
jgi:hypothetical protein